MDHLIYTAASGASRTIEQQSVISNNLANISTSGFREQLSLYRAIPVIGRAGEHQTRATTLVSTPGTKMEQGVMAETGNPLDLAIAGEGWFAVQTPQGEAYTRAGDLSINSNNLLVTATGLPVLSEDGGQIELPERGSVTFANDGTITALGAGDNPRDIQIMGQLKLVNPDPATLVRSEDGLFRLAEGQAAPADPAVRIAAGFVEKSNVNPAEAMVGMIANARRFEIQMKMIQDASTNAERANSILSSNG